MSQNRSNASTWTSRGPRRVPPQVPDLAALKAANPDAFVTVADHVVAPTLAAAGLRTVVQNDGQRRPGGFVLPMFPQSGLEPRDAGRGDAVERVVFVGCRGQLRADFASPAFAAAARRLGVEFDVVDKGRAAEWGCAQRTADLTLAVRPAHVELARKPPTKLVNAWCAGCPALLGPEPAYRSLREDDLDYVEVDSPRAALDAIARLRNDPALYARMRRRCAERAADYSNRRTAERWAAVLFTH